MGWNDPRCSCCECQGKKCFMDHPGHNHRALETFIRSKPVLPFMEPDGHGGYWFTDANGDGWRLIPTGDPDMPLTIQLHKRNTQ